jgi:invasion protein IalB
MKTKMFMIAALGLLAFAAPAIAATETETAAKPAAAARPTPVSTKFDDWTMQCISSTKGKYCGLYQKAFATVDGKKAMAVLSEVEVMKSKDGKKTPHMRLITPLGSWLPSNIGFKLDEEKQNIVPYFMCGRTGCMTDLTLEKEHIDRLKKGKRLLVAYRTSPKKEDQIEAPLSMKGFAAALDALLKN